MTAAVVTIFLALVATGAFMWGLDRLDHTINRNLYGERDRLRRRELEREVADLAEALRQYPNPTEGGIADLRVVLRSRFREAGASTKEADNVLANLLGGVRR